MSGQIVCMGGWALCLAGCSAPSSDAGTWEPLAPLADAGSIPRVGQDAGTPASAPLFSHRHGLYTEPFKLVLTPQVVPAEVRYTLDGRDPRGAAAHAYTAPVPIETTTVVRVAVLVAGEVAAAPAAQTYLFAQHIPAQQAPADYPSQWWISDAAGPFAADYEMDPEITVERYPHGFPGVFHALPIVSLVMSPEDLFGPMGIHDNAEESGVTWERAASMEMFAADGSADFSLICGIRIQGGSSRKPERTPKKSFRVLFKADYGETKLKYPLYPGSPVHTFDTLILRSHYNRAWSHYSYRQRRRAQYLREQFGAETQRAMGHLAPWGRQTHLFINGIYWGIYLLQERPDASFQAEHLGGEKSDYDAINTGEANDGDRVAWDQMMAIVEAGVAEQAAYDAVQQWLDIDNFIDYVLLNIYFANIDWPDRNWRTGRHRSAEGRFLFFNWDTELMMGNLDLTMVEADWPDSPGRIWQRLRENPAFRARVAERAVSHFQDGGALAPESLIARWNLLSSALEPALVAESARWGDHWRDVRGDPEGELYTYDDHWLPERARIVEYYLPQRRAVVIEQLRAVGLYPL